MRHCTILLGSALSFLLMNTTSRYSMLWKYRRSHAPIATFCAVCIPRSSPMTRTSNSHSSRASANFPKSACSLASTILQTSPLIHNIPPYAATPRRTSIPYSRQNCRVWIERRSATGTTAIVGGDRRRSIIPSTSSCCSEAELRSLLVRDRHADISDRDAAIARGRCAGSGQHAGQ